MVITAQLIGYPRIGPNRELKWALEKAWSGRMETDAFAARIAELRQEHLDEQRAAIGSAVDDYFLYDEVLETALMLGISPPEVGDPADRCLRRPHRARPRHAGARGVGDDEVVRHELPLRRPRDHRTDPRPPPAAVARAGWPGRRDVADPRAVQPRQAQQARRRPRPGDRRPLRRRRALDLASQPARDVPAPARRAEPRHGHDRCRPTHPRRRLRGRGRPGDTADRDDAVRTGIGRDAGGARSQGLRRPGGPRPGARAHRYRGLGRAARARRVRHGRPQRVARLVRARARRPGCHRRRQADPPRPDHELPPPAGDRRGRGPAARLPVRAREGAGAGGMAGGDARRRGAIGPGAAAGRSGRRSAS